MSTKGFLGGLGQGMMQLSATYGQTGLANLEAEAQRMKEERLATMQMAQFSLQSQKDVYQMEMGEKKFALLQDEDLRRQEELELKKQKQQYDQDLPDYEKVEKDVYKPVKDLGGNIIGYEKADEDIYYINKKNKEVFQLKDGKLIPVDPDTAVGGDEKKETTEIKKSDWKSGDPIEILEATQEEYINNVIARQQRLNPSFTMSEEEKAETIELYLKQRPGQRFKEGGTIYFKQPEIEEVVEKEIIGPESFVDFVPPKEVVNPSATVVPGDIVRDDTTQSGITQQKGWTAIEENAMRDQVNNDTEFLTALEAELGEDVAIEVWNQRIEDEVLRRLRGEVADQGLIIRPTDPQYTKTEKDEVKKEEVEETNILKMDYDQAIKVIRDTVKRMEDQKMTKSQITDALFKVVQASGTSKEFNESKYAKALNDVIIELGSR